MCAVVSASDGFRELERERGLGNTKFIVEQIRKCLQLYAAMGEKCYVIQ